MSGFTRGMGGFGQPHQPAPSGFNGAAANFGNVSTPDPSSFSFGSVQPAAGSSSFGPTSGPAQPTTPVYFGAAAPNTAFGASPNVVTASRSNQYSSGRNPSFGLEARSVPTNSGQGFLPPAGSQAPSQSLLPPKQNNPFQSSSTANRDMSMTFGTSSNVVSQRTSQPVSSSYGNAWASSSSDGNSNPFGNSSGPHSTSVPNARGHSNNGHTLESAPPSFSSPSGSDQAYVVVSSLPSNENDDSKDDLRLQANREEKKRLQAIIEEKKRKLLERKQKRSQPLDNAMPQSELIATKPLGKSSQSDLAQRNAVRFRNQTSQPEPKSKASATSQSKDIRKDLEKAAALAGKCPYMCPDDELQRRERENDIQQLELPLPGKLHPRDWSIRDTAIKRFRRSAADYKLDVPEWVRPPDVLERVCGYIEEWVMERDRQGPDPRFSQNQAPPALEVYQFIWDRTRMIRKDLTLQNYVGTGGNCDARAVRCHERIARWHAMCEHQLSHITEFATMQSQQNIQELGQTMKTLNQFYDDSLNRSVVEVPDQNGKETRLDMGDLSHGCAVDNVQGKEPVDFDGKLLNNSVSNAAVAKRLIGKHAINHPSHGTAEPEMRGLYILLTIDNDGGMEVLKYAAKLFKERPAVYHSRPVQLALNIYKAKKEYNYARFFSILRSPTTPYLFACVMFKYVELMRKVAFRIMSKSFGARKRDTGEPISDAYPLSRLTELLCFENLNEARDACQHYNIAVDDTPTPSSQGSTATKEVLFWRRSDFKEPVHPEKGFVLPLRPRKMTRIIESKLNGATRLAVCRGEVSGKGATLSDMPRAVRCDSSLAVAGAADTRTFLAAEPKCDARASTVTPSFSSLLEKQKVEFSRIAQNSKSTADNQEGKPGHLVSLPAGEEKQKQSKLLAEENKRNLETERLALQEKLVQEQRRQLEAEAKRRVEVEKQQMEMARRKLIEQQEQANREAESRRKAEELRKLEELRLAEERSRRKKELDEQKRKDFNRQRARERERRAAEEAIKREQEAENLRKENEAKRLEILKKEFELKRRKEAEQRKKAREWKARADKSRRLLLWSRWKRRLERRLMIFAGRQSHMNDTDPIFVATKLHIGAALQSALAQRSILANEKGASSSVGPRRIIEQLLRVESSGLNMSSMVIDTILKHPRLGMPLNSKSGGLYCSKTTLLLKVGVVIPTLFNHQGQDIAELVRRWIGSRLSAGRVISRAMNQLELGRMEVRSIVVCSPNYSVLSGCDVAIFVVPPCLSDFARTVSEFQSACLSKGGSVPSVSLVLGDLSNPGYANMVSEALQVATNADEGKGEIVVCPPDLSVAAYESALESVCLRVVNLFLAENCVQIVRMPTMRLAYVTVFGSLWRKMSKWLDSNPNSILQLARLALDELVDEIAEQQSMHKREWQRWPASEFVEASEVQEYFSPSEGLPGNWAESLGRLQINGAVASLRNKIDGTFCDVIQSFLVDAKPDVFEECRKFTSEQWFRKCLELAIMTSLPIDSSEWGFVYLPTGISEVIVENALTRAEKRFEVQYSKLLDGASTPLTLGKNEPMLSVANRPTTRTHPGRLGVKKKHSLESPDATLLKRRRLQQGNRVRSSHQDSVSPPRDFISKNVEESAEFSRTLENLSRGGTVDVSVGDIMLSQILLGIPVINEATNF